MPYRRLPNTDQARLHALKTAIQHASEAAFNEQVIAYHTISEAQKLLCVFENQVQQFQANFQTKTTANKEGRHVAGNARMYISHFIQVLNLAVIRGEIKREQKALYHLDPERNTLPDLSSDDNILLWGKNIIEGETERQRQGGFPIYNPSISKVKVYYDIFKDQQVNQEMHRKNAERLNGDLAGLRLQVDNLILDIWNQVENKYKDLLPYDKLRHCESYGLIYYYRAGEEKMSADTDEELRRLKAMQPELGL